MDKFSLEEIFKHRTCLFLFLFRLKSFRSFSFSFLFFYIDVLFMERNIFGVLLDLGMRERERKREGKGKLLTKLMCFALLFEMFCYEKNRKKQQRQKSYVFTFPLSPSPSLYLSDISPHSLPHTFVSCLFDTSFFLFAFLSRKLQLSLEAPQK